MLRCDLGDLGKCMRIYVIPRSSSGFVLFNTIPGVLVGVGGFPSVSNTSNWVCIGVECESWCICGEVM